MNFVGGVIVNQESDRSGKGQSVWGAFGKRDSGRSGKRHSGRSGKGEFDRKASNYYAVVVGLVGWLQFDSSIGHTLRDLDIYVMKSRSKGFCKSPDNWNPTSGTAPSTLPKLSSTQ